VGGSATECVAFLDCLADCDGGDCMESCQQGNLMGYVRWFCHQQLCMSQCTDPSNVPCE
jgi:hypothetical protein